MLQASDEDSDSVLVTISSENRLEETEIHRGICAVRGSSDTDTFIIVGNAFIYTRLSRNLG